VKSASHFAVPSVVATMTNGSGACVSEPVDGAVEGVPPANSGPASHGATWVA
jgi:hypothetical protein